MAGDRNGILRHAFDKELLSLGGSIHQTIMWHLDNRGIFSDPHSIDIRSLYSNLQEIIGPHADMMMDMIWSYLEKNHNVRDTGKARSLDKIQRWLDMEGKI